MPTARTRSVSKNIPTTQLLAALFVLLLLVKFLWPFFTYPLPLGYDTGIYRYLFARHAEGFPPFVMVDIPEWAKGHPLGLFFFTTLLIRAGIPVDWLIGWMWNLFPVLLAITLGWVTAKRSNATIGVLTLLAALLSVAYFDGFVAMYWKTFASLFWVVLTFHLLERTSRIAAVTGILAVATHHQTGLLFGLAFAWWVAVGIAESWEKKRRFPREFLLPLLVGISVFTIGILWYLPVWKEAVLAHIPELLAGDSSPGGNFPDATFYLRTEGILLALGFVGLLLSLKKESFTLWQLSVGWSFVFVAFHLFFFRRFFLQLDFFLLPFVAIAIHTFWTSYPQKSARSILILTLVIQALATLQVVLTRTPILDAVTFASVTSLSSVIPANATVIVPDNQSPPYVQGWLPKDHIAGPGLFESAWTYDQWKVFLLGSHTDRKSLLTAIPGDVYLFASPFFLQYYGTVASTFLSDSCFVPLQNGAYKVSCP